MYAWRALVGMWSTLHVLPYSTLDTVKLMAPLHPYHFVLFPFVDVLALLFVLINLLRGLRILPWRQTRPLRFLLHTAAFWAIRLSTLVTISPAKSPRIWSLPLPPWFFRLYRSLPPRTGSDCLSSLYKPAAQASALHAHVYVVLEGVLFGLASPFLLAFGTIEAIFYSSAAMLVGSVWLVLYHDLFKKLWHRLTPKPRPLELECILQRLAPCEMTTCRQYHGAQSSLDARLSQLQQPHLRGLLSELDAPWLDLLEQDYTYLSNINTILSAKLSACPPSPAIYPRSFRHCTAEIAGIVLRYLLPFSAFKHLHPGACFSALSDALTGIYTLSPSITPPQMRTLFSSYLRTVKARYIAAKAEEKAHEEILDAVLDWKARKVDEARVESRRKLKTE
ncbi:hypothetical protein JCM8097_005981 [Rhodosporidiobolus ruineniae]